MFIEEMTTDNPNLTIEKLNEIESRVDSNTQTIGDLELVNDYINLTHPNYLIQLLKSKNIFTFQQFIDERNKTSNRNPHIDVLVGNVLGIVNYLKNNVV